MCMSTFNVLKTRSVSFAFKKLGWAFFALMLRKTYSLSKLSTFDDL